MRAIPWLQQSKKILIFLLIKLASKLIVGIDIPRDKLISRSNLMNQDCDSWSIGINLALSWWLRVLLMNNRLKSSYWLLRAITRRWLETELFQTHLITQSPSPPLSTNLPNGRVMWVNPRRLQPLQFKIGTFSSSSSSSSTTWFGCWGVGTWALVVASVVATRMTRRVGWGGGGCYELLLIVRTLLDLEKLKSLSTS